MTTTTKASPNGATAPAEGALHIEAIGLAALLVPIVGLSPLVAHKFSEKAKKQMLDAMQGKRTPKVSKDPAAEYEAAAYRFPDGDFGFPSVAFKAATVSAARFFGRDVSMTALRQVLFVDGEPDVEGTSLVRIDGEPTMREDVVRVGRGGTDLRYRPQFTSWKANLLVTYVRSMLTASSVLSLIDAGGRCVGVGEWRPERNGTFGTYHIDTERQVVTMDSVPT
jgi:hypothetical protein